MKITKTFGMTLSAKYQSYTFSTTVEAEFPQDSDAEKMNSDLSEAAVNATLNDIESFMDKDSDFKAVFFARQDELDRFKATLKAKGRLGSTTTA
jgi:hypothetical protein